MNSPGPPIPADAMVFKFPWSLRVLMLGCAVGAFGFLVFTLAGHLVDPAQVSLALTILGAAVFGSLMVGALQASARFRGRVATSPEGLWYLLRKTEPTFIAWRDVASVEAHDTAQRLVLVDARDATKLRLEYQLEDFGKLRDFVLTHVSSTARLPATVPNVFHRTWLNKGAFLVLAAVWLFLARLSWSPRQPVPSLVLVAFAALQLAMIARDPTRVVIMPGGVAVEYPGWKQTIPFNAISQVELTDVRGSSDVWAAVIIKRKKGKPLRLFRFREGSITLHHALLSAWNSAGGHN